LVGCFAFVIIKSRPLKESTSFYASTSLCPFIAQSRLKMPPAWLILLYHVGEQHGIGYTLDVLILVTEPPRKHFCLPHLAVNLTMPEALSSFLPVKVVFPLPSIAIYKALLCFYFLHDHPPSFLPIVNAEAVLSSYKEGGRNRWILYSYKINFLLQPI
jgi:hypothetical protein